MLLRICDFVSLSLLVALVGGRVVALVQWLLVGLGVLRVCIGLLHV